MSLLNELIELYPDVDASILAQYQAADTVVVYNQDPSLHPIHVDVAKVIQKVYESKTKKSAFDEHKYKLLAGFYPEMWHTIEGFGKPAKEQKFTREKLPPKLLSLQSDYINDDRGESLKIIWDKIENAPDVYKSETKYILKCHHHRHYGKWVFINGKPTWFDPFAYFYFNFWTLDIGAPDYRDRSRRKFLFAQYCYTTTDAFFTYKATVNGKVRYTNDERRVKEWERQKLIVQKGEFLVDMGKRTCYGYNEPKHRRAGATYESACINYVIGTSRQNLKGAMQSKDRTTAEKCWQEAYQEPIRKLPFFFIPFHEIKKSEYFFRIPKQKKGLSSRLWYADSADAKKLDGVKLHCFHNNECGKTTETSILERHDIVKRCLQMGEGSNIIGLMINESTVAEMEKAGGGEFYQLCKNSHWQKRINDIGGETESGCFNLFLSGLDGLEKFIDEFGNSVIETPEKPVVGIDGELIHFGAKEKVMEERAALEQKNDYESIRTLHNKRRLCPVTFQDCFISSGAASGFNTQILSDRLSQLRFNDELLPIRGDFKWIEKYKKSEFIPDPVNGRWLVSYFFPDDRMANKSYVSENIRYPSNPKSFVLSFDPFAFNKTLSSPSRLSSGGGAVFMCRDFTFDGDEKDIKDWSTHRFICSYNFRPLTKEEFVDDMLMPAVYYGAMIYPENDVIACIEEIQKQNMGGYLLYDMDKVTGKPNANPGFSAKGNGSIKQDLFQEIKEYVEKHGLRERHPDILQEILDIDGLEDMTNHDLFTAAAGCLRGAKSLHREYLVNEQDAQTEGSSFEDFFLSFKY